MGAEPFFIVSSGRSGTAMLHKALCADPQVEMHHEYMVHIVQPLGVKRYWDSVSRDEAMRILDATHGAAIRCSTAVHWGDSSNKLSWLIPELAALFPRAKFVHLVRDGRKVASSYFHKLGDENYDDRSTGILQSFHDGLGPAPPPEKKYWWALPRKGDQAAERFRAFDQFQRIAWHWAEVNRVVSQSLASIAPERQHFVRLEDLVSSGDAVRSLWRFLGLRLRDDQLRMFARPHNVNRPEDKLLDATQRTAFDGIASEAMTRFGYADTPEYVVNY